MATEEVSFLDENTGTLDSRTKSFRNNDVFSNSTIDVKNYSLKFAVVTLIIVVTLIGLSYYLNRKRIGVSGSEIKVIENLQIGPGKNISLVMIPGEVLVIGTTGTSINVLSRIDDPEIIDRLKDKFNGKPQNFKEMLLVNSLDALMPEKKKKR